MSIEKFKITSSKEAEQFEKYTLEYVKYYLRPYFHCNFRLGEIFEDCQKNKNGGKIFSASLDLYISVHLVAQDIYSAAGAWNKYFSKESKIAKMSDDIFINPNAYFGRMLIHRHLSAFIPRYRAVWDKIFGLYFLVYQFEDYDNFFKAKSKKKYFLINFANFETLDDDFKKYIKVDLPQFDDAYRTSEVHGTGSLRNYTFQPINGSFSKDNPMRFVMENHWQKFMNLCGRIMLVFDNIKAT